MPTSAASGAILPRISSAMARTSFSGSGSGMRARLPGMVEIALQDHRGGEGIDVGLAAAPAAHRAQLHLGARRSEGLVDESDGEAVTRREPARELRRELRHRMPA